MALSASTVHDWHRRLRAEVFLQRLADGEHEIPSGVVALREATGRIRDIDVATEELLRWSRSEAHGGLEGTVRSALAALRTESARRRARLHRLLRSEPTLSTLLLRPTSVDPALARAARAEVLVRLRRAQHRAVRRASRRRLHRIRKRIRELGLLRQVEEAGTSTGSPRLHGELRTLMRRLGRTNDRAVLIRWMSRHRDGAGSTELLRALRRTQRRDRDSIVARLGRVRRADWER